MTQALLSDLASQSQQIRDLTTEVQNLKQGSNAASLQVRRNAKAGSKYVPKEDILEV